MKTVLFSVLGISAVVAMYFVLQPKPRPQAPSVPKAVATSSVKPVAPPVPKAVVNDDKVATTVAATIATAKSGIATATNKDNVVLTPTLPKAKPLTTRETPSEYKAPTTEPTAASGLYRGAHYRFDTETINYGVITKGSNGKRKFRFVNDGSEPLTIANVLPGCHCVTADSPKQPIEPGKSGYIEVEYDTTIEGDFIKDFIVTSNAEGDDGTKIVYVKGTVR
jgi:Protein of unknown function (DUF1573)